MTHHGDTPEHDPAETDDVLREAQTGKGYGEDEGEREAAVEDDDASEGAG